MQEVHEAFLTISTRFWTMFRTNERFFVCCNLKSPNLMIWDASQIRQKSVSIEHRRKKNIEYNFKWNHLYLSRVSNSSRDSFSLNSASGYIILWKELSLNIKFTFQIQKTLWHLKISNKQLSLQRHKICFRNWIRKF